MRLATWNLARARPDGVRADRLCDHMRRVDADVWVLTETWRGLSPGAEYRLVGESTGGRDGKEDRSPADPEEIWVGIWSRLDGAATALPTIAPRRTVAVRLASGQRPLVVYGTVLPWSSDAAGPGTRGAEKFCLALQEQHRDWTRLLAEHPDTKLCVAGDFNQDLAERHYYGTKAGRAALRHALGASGLTCLTASTDDPVARPGPDEEGLVWATVDHICVTPGLIPHGGAHVCSWPERSELGPRLTDHLGVVATLSSSRSRCSER